LLVGCADPVASGAGGSRLEGDSPRVEDIVRALVEPTMAFRDSGPGARAFIGFLGRGFYETDDTVRSRFFSYVQEFFLLLFATLEEALPGLSSEALFWRLQFAFGAMGHLLTQGERSRLVPPGVVGTWDSEAVTAHLVEFMTAGIRGGGEL